MKIEDIKDKLINMYQKSLNMQSDNLIKHPIRIIDSAKSIIGINPNDPFEKALDICDNYLSKFEIKDVQIDLKNIKPREVVTYLDLELSLLEKNKLKSLEHIKQLSRVSDGKQIFEFLIEFSLKYCNCSFLLIYSIYRMQLFMDFEKVNESLYLCVRTIIDDIGKNRIGISGDIETFLSDYIVDLETVEIFYNLYRIYNEDFTRKSKIQPYVLSAIREKCKIVNNNKEKYVFDDNQIQSGRKWILENLKNGNNYMNSDIMLILDSLRGALKLSKKKNNIKKIWNDLNTVYEY
tara:strand:+ start:2123 stop:2998 length:876 start_codon:yes stop_codon:yes gene_type:complete